MRKEVGGAGGGAVVPHAYSCMGRPYEHHAAVQGQARGPGRRRCQRVHRRHQQGGPRRIRACVQGRQRSDHRHQRCAAGGKCLNVPPRGCLQHTPCSASVAERGGGNAHVWQAGLPWPLLPPARPPTHPPTPGPHGHLHLRLHQHPALGRRMLLPSSLPVTPPPPPHTHRSCP